MKAIHPLCLMAALLLLLLPIEAWADTERVSIASDGTQGNNSSTDPKLSNGGRFVVFISEADNLVANDTNTARDVFVHDRQTQTTERVSVSSANMEGDNDSGNAGGAGNVRVGISADGRFVVFQSAATNLVAGDGNSLSDVFVRDRLNGQTERVSVDPGGMELTGFSGDPAISANGRFVAFVSATPAVPGDGNNHFDVFLRDRLAATTERVSVGSGGSESNGSSHQPSLSADGRFVAFLSDATNLVPGDTNDALDIFVHDRLTATTQRVSVSSTGEQANDLSQQPKISADGRFVVFHSDATNLVADDTNSEADTFVHDRQTGTTTRVSVALDGAQANVGSGSSSPAISDDGRYIAFQSASTNLVPDDTNDVADVFVKDRLTGMIRRVSLGADGAQANEGSSRLDLDGSGRVVAFDSPASNLVPNDTNRVSDVFVRKLPIFPYEYVAKFICGTQTEENDLRLARGVYATTVNIHNSHPSIEFLKKLALTYPPRAQQPGQVYPIAQHVLQYDEAIGVTCTNIRNEVFGGAFPERYIEGFLVIQSTDSIDVTAVYTSAAIDRTGGISDHSSIDVEQIVERNRGVDLRIDKSATLFEFPIGLIVIHAMLYQIDITNSGAADANDLVVLDELLLETTNAIGIVDVLTVPLELPPGGQMTNLVEGSPTASFQLKLGDLAAGDSITVRFWVLAPTYVYGSPASATLRNVATVHSNEVELTPGNNTVTVDTQLVP